jgi:hypothetical protein
MAKLTWLGSEDYREGETPLEACEWCGVLFTAGDRVEVTDQWMISKARGNHFFRVEEDEVPASFIGPLGHPERLPATQWREPATEADPADVSWFDDPPEADLPPRPITPPEDLPDYPPEDEPDQRPKRRGRPPRIRDNADGV